ncbi:Tat pathway signal sequence domain protein [Streptomyces sp. NPDC058268]|uniref:Tat pathway signal sequence domain protein n=1 Tax=Streptomyces sp. NPDC058268 TaxID=3346413 RepID=UPI0036EE84DA
MGVNAIGPIEPGDNTYDTGAAATDQSRGQGQGQGQSQDLDQVTVHPVRPRPLLTRHRRTALAVATAVVVGAAGLSLYLTRPRPPAPPPPLYPSQTVAVTYRGDMTHPQAGDATFSFTVSVSQDSGPPVAVRRITQPSEALSVTVAPHTPFDVKTGSPRTARITMHIRECGNVQRNAGLPFLVVTLRNVRAKQLQSFILGERYAKDLSKALTAACPPNTDVMSKTP